MASIELDGSSFEETVRGNGVVVVDFWAPWCGPCRGFAPVFEAASLRHADVVFAKVNTEAEPDLARACQIASIPTLMIFREQILLYAEPGALPAAALDELLARAKALDMDEVRRELDAEAEAGGDGEDAGR